MSESELTMSSASLEFIEGLYEDYLKDPASVPDKWRDYFEKMGGVAGHDDAPPAAQVRPTFEPRSMFNPPDGNGHKGGNGHGAAKPDGGQTTIAPAPPPPAPTAPPQPALAPAPAAAPAPGTALEAEHMVVLQDRVDQLVRAYRARGHLAAQIDPLGAPRPDVRSLDPAGYGFTPDDMMRTFSTDTIDASSKRRLAEITQCLHNTYCRSIGVEFMHIEDLTARAWLLQRMETCENRLTLTREEQLRVLTRLTNAVVFEEFVQKKYPGAKTFSLEGAESLVPLLDEAIERAGERGVREVVLAMAHRGRLNVLANIMGKSAQQIFREFEDTDPKLHLGRGDVKYHLGYSNDWATATGKKVHLSLCFNPSHLEFVNPVALGRMRAKQDRCGDTKRERGLCVLIHGDAAFAGEGVIQEMLNMSQLHAYSVGGTLHVIVNNQVGFTTDPTEARSSLYASDVARMLQIPIFHVNGEDPEAVCQVVRLAMDFRAAFKHDVVIDMYCYRRRGHNEGDEPSFTQPLLYEAIDARPTVRESYVSHLLKFGAITAEEAEAIVAQSRSRLEAGLEEARADDYNPRPAGNNGLWAGYIGGPESNAEEIETGVDKEKLASLLEARTRVPEGFKVHPKLERWLQTRVQMAKGEKPLDWAAAEGLAFASLAVEGHRVRLTGQDAQRGTFSQRHAVLHDMQTGKTCHPFHHLAPDQAPVDIHNSPLTETGVLGFEYGYSLDWPAGLIMWEAQFGDFINAAQVIVDQFIVSAEDKWRRLSGITLLLPHGFEGQGPEHSSARLERFLELAAEDNIQVCYPSTPAQYFHVLRRQAIRRWVKPLILMTPKSLLRNPRCVSSLDDLSRGTFGRVLPDHMEGRPPFTHIDRVLLCCGKIYFELEERRRELERADVAILRLEQLYPLPREELRAAMARYVDGTPVVWVQEEPANMGAWPFLRLNVGEMLFDRLPFTGITRRPSASPATGSHASHALEQEALLSAAFGGV